MDARRVISSSRFFDGAVLSAIILLLVILAYSPANLPAAGRSSDDQGKKSMSISGVTGAPVALDAAKQKMGASANLLMNAMGGRNPAFFSRKSNLSVYKDTAGRWMVDLFIQLNDESPLAEFQSLGVEVRARVGDILIARAPIEALKTLAQEGGVRRVEISRKRPAALDSSRANIGADLVHQGSGLPQAYRGEGVVVGVIDSGIDFTHPDFSDQNGSRILFLLEFTSGGGQNEWTKSDIDNNPGAITQIDGNGGGGHGTHVTGIATGGGRLNSAMSGIAPAADIIFVKGVRNQDSDGGFSDTDVIAGCQYIFDKAAQLGKPAVINLSLGGHNSPHDGSSLYEQSLSSLAGPGKIIVAAGGNDGTNDIHAGGNATLGVLNETIVVADSSEQFAAVDMWYDSGAISAVAVFAYDAQFNLLGRTSSLQVGQFMNPRPLVVNSDTLGFISIDAQTIQDPNNGDGDAIFVIENNDSPTIDISDVFWGIGSQGASGGRVDMWAIKGARFRTQAVGFAGETEMLGDNDYSVGTPSTAKKVIAVGSYVTKNTWVDVDGRSLTFNPKPKIAHRSTFSSLGPTRDGRVSPDIAAPGQLIFSALSNHLTEGVGYQRAFVQQGGGYLGKNGTSQAAPHVSGTVALMLQVKRDLTYEQAIQALSATARTNQFTGATPNNNVGAGYLDAHAAVSRIVDLVSSVENAEVPVPQSFVLRQNYPNPFNPTTNIEYTLNRAARTVVRVYNLRGQEIITLVNEKKGRGTYSVSWGGKDANGAQVASGLYYLRLTAGDFSATRKMLLMR